MVFKKFSSRFSWLTVIIMLFVSLDTLMFGTNRDGTVIMLGYAVLFMLTAIYVYKCCFLRPYVSINKKMLWLLGLNVVTMAVNLDMTIKYCYACMLILLAYFFTKTVSLDEFKHMYKKVVLVLSVASIVTTVLSGVIPLLGSWIPVVKNTSGLEYYNLLLAMVPVETLGIIYRSYGVFREPGIFVIFLLFALLMELMERNKKPSIRNAVIYMVALLTTYSTAGYIALAVLLLSFLFYNQHSKKHQMLKYVVLILFIVAVFFVYTDEVVYNKVFSKMVVEGNNSYASRFGSFTVNLKIAFRDIFHLIVGNGFSYTNEAFIRIGQETYSFTIYNTNTLLKALAVYGVFYWWILINGILKFVGRIAPNAICVFGLMITVAMLLSNGDITLNVFIYLIIFYTDQGNGNVLFLNKRRRV